MGFLDFLKVKKTGKEALVPPGALAKEESSETCSYCNQPGADRAFAGMPWHKKCLRAARRQAKGMI